MKKILTCHTMVRALSLLLPLSLVLEHVLRTPGISRWYICACIVPGIGVCLMSPLGYENPKPSLDFALTASLLTALCGWFASRLPFGTELLLCAGLVPIAVYSRWRQSRKYVNVRSLFRADSVWCSVEDSARESYVSALFGLGVLLMAAHAADAGPVWAGVMTAVTAVFFVLNYLRIYSGRTGFIPKEKEKAIKEIIRGNLRGALPDVEVDEHMTAIYSKVTAYMDDKKPYLDDRFSMDDLATAGFCNRAYLSKAINCFSGRNFRQFANYYRVNYSIDLMKKDPHLKVMELAMMSGFHSVVTYNMAFKLYTGTTPSAYLQDLIRRRRQEHLSR